MTLSISTEDAKEFNNMRNFNVGVKIPIILKTIGKMIEIITKGATETSIYLDFEIFSSVST